MANIMNPKLLEWIVIAIVIIIIICILQKQGTIPVIIPMNICSLIPAGLLPPGGNGNGNGGGGGGGAPGDEEPDPIPSPLCTDFDGASRDRGIWIGSYATSAVTSGSQEDACESIIYLDEAICNSDGTLGIMTVDCRTHGAWCHPTLKACAKTTCEAAVNPISQADCEGLEGCYGDEDYCKFISGIAAPNRCVCTIDPAKIDLCSDGCNYLGYSSWQCSDNVPAKNPCLIGTWQGAYDQYCPLVLGGFLHEACCCS